MGLFPACQILPATDLPAVLQEFLPAYTPATSAPFCSAAVERWEWDAPLPRYRSGCLPAVPVFLDYHSCLPGLPLGTTTAIRAAWDAVLPDTGTAVSRLGHLCLPACIPTCAGWNSATCGAGCTVPWEVILGGLWGCHLHACLLLPMHSGDYRCRATRFTTTCLFWATFACHYQVSCHQVGGSACRFLLPAMHFCILGVGHFLPAPPG